MKKIQPLDIKPTRSWDEFRRHFRHFFPDVDVSPHGCWPEAYTLCRRHNVDLVDYIRRAGGDRAGTIVDMFSYTRLWPSDTVVKDVLEAPGDRASSLFRLRCIWRYSIPHYVEEMRKAPGERAYAIYHSWKEGEWATEHLVADIRTAPGRRIAPLAALVLNGIWPKDTFEEDVRTSPDYSARFLYWIRIKGAPWTLSRWEDDIRDAPGPRATVIRDARRRGWWSEERYQRDLNAAEEHDAALTTTHKT